MSVIEQQVPTGVWTVDKVHSHVGFEVKHMVVGKFRTEFEDFDARLTVNGEPHLVGTVPVSSVQARDENLAAHLQSPDFFDAENHPEIRFESRSFRTEGDQLIVDGDFTIKGITKQVEARGELTGPHTDIAGSEKLGLDLEAVVDRTEFGLNWNAPLPKGGFALANDVKLIVHLELAKAE